MKIKTNAIRNAPICKHLNISDDKRVFVVGDLDADLTKLRTELQKVDFEAGKDLLISLGDIIDRGPDSVRMVKYFHQHGVQMVLGNHEHMMLEALLSRDSYALRLWTQNGGKWHQSESFQTLVAMCKWFAKKPLSIKLQYQGKTIGISHTLPPTWSWATMPDNAEACAIPLMWDRERFTKRKHQVNHGVDFSIHGHNSTPECLWIGNSYHIDTGQYGSPTVIDVSETIAAFSQQ